MSLFPAIRRHHRLFWLGALLCLLNPAVQAQTASASALYSFPAGNYPVSSLIQASDGNYYGVTNFGGANGEGSVYQLTPQGVFTTIYSFTGLATDGGEPAAGLVEASDGSLYGTTTVGGANGVGTVFRVSFSGALTTLHSFDPDVDGSTPYAALIPASDGRFYGTLSQGAYDVSNGLFAGGTIFSITTAGAYANVASLPVDGSLGSSPSARLLQASDGKLYGVASAGGSNDMGTLFSCDSNGVVTALYNFGTADGSPLYGMVESGGMLYGATFPNPDGYGEVFSFSLTMQTFAVVFPFAGDSNGGLPATALFPTGDGGLYGTTQEAGNGTGTLFQLNAPASLATLYDFPGGTLNTYTDAALLEGSDGSFYDAVQFDPTVGLGSSQMDGAGTLFRLKPSKPVAPPITLMASAATVGVNRPFTLSWSVPAAASLTAQQCFATTSGPGSSAAWSGTKLSTGSQSMSMNAMGAYSFSLTCGGNVTAVTTVAVGESYPATVRLNGPASVVQGQHATLSATVSATGSGPAPTGAVTFIADGSINIATLNLSSGSASFTASTAGVPAGTYQVTAKYSGDSSYADATSAPVKLSVVSSVVATTTALNATPNPVKSGKTITLTATVKGTSGSVAPAGSVQFLFAGTVIATVKLTNGIATFRASTDGIAAGSYVIRAVYLGNSGMKASTSPAITVKITK